jgi:nucleoside 2-deoxyribosyltransferase
MLPTEDKRPIKLVYIAGPIDGISREEAQNWRVEAYDFLASIGVVSAVPGLEKTKMKSDQIVKLDDNMINLCDCILVNLSYLTKKPEKWWGTGTLVELGMAFARRKIIVAFTNGAELDANFLFLRGIFDYKFNSMEEALNCIKTINNE